MAERLLDRRVVRAPDFGRGRWLNTEQPLTMRGLRGRVVLVDIWEYSCVNCLRTLPYLREWHRRYAAVGLTIVGVHSPEFAFGREKSQIEMAVEELEIPYPVLMDNDYRTWTAFANRFWPAKYLIDQQGYMRYSSHGEGGYAALERAIQTLLREMQPNVDLPPIMQPVRAEDEPGAVCYRPTAEMAAGLHYGALGNPEGYARAASMLYQMPEKRPPDAFYVSGPWQAGSQHLAYQGQSEGVLRLPYEAVEVNAVMASHFDAVERLLNPQTAAAEIWQDDRPLPDETRGRDVTADGRVLVGRPRLYNLVHNPGFERHELTLRVGTRGFAVFAFSFTGCVRQDA